MTDTKSAIFNHHILHFGIAGNLLTFAVGYTAARLFRPHPRPREVTNLTLWTSTAASDE